MTPCLLLLLMHRHNPQGLNQQAETSEVVAPRKDATYCYVLLRRDI
jgi:hypothetical protein